MFEIHVGELRATFLRNHNMRHHNDPTKCPKPGRQPKQTTQAQKTPTFPATTTTATSVGALHLIRGTTPDMGRCTRYVALHPLRGGAPEQKRCIAYGSGAVPQQTRTNAELAHRTTHRRTPPCAAGPYWRQDGHAAHAATCTPAHSGPIRHLLHPYMRRAGKDAERAGPRRRREKRSARPGAGQGPASGRWPTGRRSARTLPR